MIQPVEQHPEYNMISIDDSKEYTSPTFSPEDDFRQFGPRCGDYTPEKIDWQFQNTRYAVPTVDFLPDAVVQDYNDNRMERIAKLEAMVEELRLNQQINNLPRKERKHSKIIKGQPTKVKDRLRKKLEEKREEKNNFLC